MLFSAFGLPFMSTALAALLLIAATVGPISTLVSLRGLEFLSEGVIHAVFPGIVIGYVVASVPGLYVGALIAATIAAAALTLIARNGVASGPAIAIVLTSAFGVGVIVVSRQSDYAGQLQQLLFGRLFTIAPSELVPLAAGLAVALTLVTVTWRRQVYVAFDRAGAIAAGANPLLTDLVLNIAIAIAVVAASAAVGNLLVLAVIIIPGAVGRLVGGLLSVGVAVATLFGAMAAWLGLAAAFSLSLSLSGATHLPGGAATVLVMVLAYLVAAASRLGWDAMLSRRRPRQR